MCDSSMAKFFTTPMLWYFLFLCFIYLMELSVRAGMRVRWCFNMIEIVDFGVLTINNVQVTLMQTLRIIPTQNVVIVLRVVQPVFLIYNVSMQRFFLAVEIIASPDVPNSDSLVIIWFSNSGPSSLMSEVSADPQLVPSPQKLRCLTFSNSFILGQMIVLVSL